MTDNFKANAVLTNPVSPPADALLNPHNVVLWAAWRHGLDGRDWLHQTPLFIAGVGALTGVTGIAVEFVDSTFSLPVPILATLIAGTAMVLAGLGAQSHVHGQAAKHNRNLK